MPEELRELLEVIRRRHEAVRAEMARAEEHAQWPQVVEEQPELAQTVRGLREQMALMDDLIDHPDGLRPEEYEQALSHGYRHVDSLEMALAGLETLVRTLRLRNGEDPDAPGGRRSLN